MVRRLGPEAGKAYEKRLRSGFIERYLSGDAVLDIGYRGETPDALPITDKAIGIDLDYPGYDGRTLPFAEGSQDAVFASHCLEHVADYRTALADWYRVLRVGGFLVIAVPHQYLYERKAAPPSRFNEDHKRFYTPASLLAEIEESLPLDGYRVRWLRDNDDGFDYNVEAAVHASGGYEIELVVEKIRLPRHALGETANNVRRQLESFADALRQARIAKSEQRQGDFERLLRDLMARPLPPYAALRAALPEADDAADLREIVRALVAAAPLDETLYLERNPDVAAYGGSARAHYVAHGYFERRPAQPQDPVYS